MYNVIMIYNKLSYVLIRQPGDITTENSIKYVFLPI